MDVQPYEKMIELVQRAEEKGVTLVLTFQANIDEVGESSPFNAIATNSTDDKLVTALTTSLEEVAEEIE